MKSIIYTLILRPPTLFWGPGSRCPTQIRFRSQGGKKKILFCRRPSPIIPFCHRPLVQYAQRRLNLLYTSKDMSKKIPFEFRIITIMRSSQLFSYIFFNLSNRKPGQPASQLITLQLITCSHPGSQRAQAPDPAPLILLYYLARSGKQLINSIIVVICAVVLFCWIILL